VECEDVVVLLLLADHDFSDVIIEGVLRICPGLDFVRAREVGLQRAHDFEILEWAAANGRLTISHDANTMTDAAYDRIRTQLPMRGLVIVPQSLAYRTAIEDLALIASCCEPDEWINLVRFLSLHP
jgi:Domain of unknown function (DUF5615)